MKLIILFELHHLGDAVLSAPFVRAAKECELHVVCRKGSSEVYRKWLPTNQIHIWEPWWEQRGQDKIDSLRKLRTLLKCLRKLKADMALCVWADTRVHWLMHQCQTPHRVGFAVNEQNFYASELPWRRRRMRLGQLLAPLFPLSISLQRKDYQQSHLEDWRQLTEALDWNWNPSPPWFDIPPTNITEQIRLPNKPLWLIHPGGRLPTKRWPLERFQQLLRTFFSQLPVILIEPPDSPALISENSNHQSVAAANLDELLALIKSADAVLCNDSLVSHLAAALGKPVWSIFGSGNPNWFAPFENHQRVIATNVCPFRPCIDRCVQPSTICLESVSVEYVVSCLKNDNVTGM